MKTLAALVHKDKGSAWCVTFPDLPRCFSVADALADGAFLVEVAHSIAR